MKRIVGVVACGVALLGGCRAAEQKTTEQPKAQKVSPARPAPAPVVAPPYRVGDGVTAPRLIKRVDPKYPELNRDYRLTTVLFECLVARDGTVRDVRLVRGPKNAFTDAIVVAVKQWQFEPGRRDGQPVDVFWNMTVNHVPDMP